MSCGPRDQYEKYVKLFEEHYVSKDDLTDCSGDPELFESAFSSVVPNPLHRTVIRLRAKNLKDRRELSNFLGNIDSELSAYTSVLLDSDAMISLEKLLSYAK